MLHLLYIQERHENYYHFVILDVQLDVEEILRALKRFF